MPILEMRATVSYPLGRDALSRRFPFHGKFARREDPRESTRVTYRVSAMERERCVYPLEGGEESRLNLAAKGTLNARNVDTMILNSREGPTRLPAHAISRSSNPSVRTKHGVGTLEEYEITWARTRTWKRRENGGRDARSDGENVRGKKGDKESAHP